MTSRTCGDSVPEVAALMYSMVHVETFQMYLRELQRLANTDLMCSIIWLKLILVASEVVKLLRLLMSCEIVLTASIKVLILCLLTCVAYLVIFKFDTMCTRVLCCAVCVAITWFILVLMLWMFFVVAVPVSQLRASPRKGSKLLLQQTCVCGWIGLQQFYGRCYCSLTRVVDVLHVGQF